MCCATFVNKKITFTQHKISNWQRVAIDLLWDVRFQKCLTWRLKVMRSSNRKIGFWYNDVLPTEYKDVLRCSFKVTVKLNWLLKLNVLDWFVLQPASVTEAVVDKIDAGLNYMMSSIQKKVKSLSRSHDHKKEMFDTRRTRTLKWN